MYCTQNALWTAHNTTVAYRVYSLMRFLPAFALLHHRFERWDHAGEKLEDNGRRDVRHDPQAEDGAHPDRCAAKHGNRAKESAGGVAACLFLPILQLLLVDDGQGNVEADAINCEQERGEEDLLAQLGYFEDRDQFIHRRTSPRLGRLDRSRRPRGRNGTELQASRAARSGQTRFLDRGPDIQTGHRQVAHRPEVGRGSSPSPPRGVNGRRPGEGATAPAGTRNRRTPRACSKACPPVTHRFQHGCGSHGDDTALRPFSHRRRRFSPRRRR